MNKFKPFMVTEAIKETIPIIDGQLIFATDTKRIYLDQNGIRGIYNTEPMSEQTINKIQSYLGIKIEKNTLTESGDSVVLKNNNDKTKNFLTDQLVSYNTYGIALQKTISEENPLDQMNFTVDIIQEWIAEKTYKIGYFVVYNNMIFKCITENSDLEFTPSNWVWVENNKEGRYYILKWSPLETYKLNDIVLYNNSLFLCLIDHTSGSEFDFSKWQGLSGVDGLAATIETEEVDDGIKVIINDINGTKTNILKNGISSTISSEKKENGDIWLTISDSNGVKIEIIEKAYSAYDLAIKNGYKGSEEEWLESLHGRDANIEMKELTELNGYSFIIEDIEGNIQTASTYSPRIDNETKNWLIGEKDTGIKAEGTVPSIDEETNNWIINGIDTGISAKGSVEINADCAVLYATFVVDGWSDTVPYIQTVTVNNIAADNTPIVDISYSADTSLWESERKAYNCLTKMETIDGGVVAYCLDSKPENDFTVKLRIAGDMSGLTFVTKDEFDKLINTNYTGMLFVDDWIGDTAPYTQTINIEGLSANLHPILDLVVSDDTTIGLSEIEEWGYISTATVSDNSITIFCYENKPTLDLNIIVKVV